MLVWSTVFEKQLFVEEKNHAIFSSKVIDNKVYKVVK